ncbi:hypothetical protein [Shewanella sp. MEBiC00475]|uniref:Acb2/Tad1 domain-containing protein n=1 Tax=Shewanella sp. MEBiC00475 TaxID=2575361 RepID=UPI0010C0E893|nr:hypothetical protein [Shewanella sp. MEBiC00475]
MDNQHKKIKGYRDLSQQEIDLMNEGKKLAEEMRAFINKLEADSDTDKRAVTIAKTNLQTGCHWVTHSIARPDSF